jgi:GH25 family lysozyme M1 (1,4-beta-N-acetylmuramidase)
MILGIDVSAWQRSISWKAVKDAGVEFGFVKATEGTGYVNPTYERHRAAARREGIPVGAYHFARPDADDGPLAEADHFLEVAAPEPGDLLPVLDFEHAGLGPRQLARWARLWLERVEKRIGQPPILYTFPSFWTSTVGNATGFSRYPLWLANYGQTTGRSTRSVASATGRAWPSTSTRREAAIPGTTGTSTSTGSCAAGRSTRSASAQRSLPRPATGRRGASSRKASRSRRRGAWTPPFSSARPSRRRRAAP